MNFGETLNEAFSKISAKIPVDNSDGMMRIRKSYVWC